MNKMITNYLIISAHESISAHENLNVDLVFRCRVYDIVMEQSKLILYQCLQQLEASLSNELKEPESQKLIRT